MVFSDVRPDDRQVLSVGELTDEELNAIALAEVPAEYARFDSEVKA